MINTGEYQIIHYCPEHKEQVLKVLEYLWSYDRDKFVSHFEWKYELNPNADCVLGIVALYREKVVGFRGYFADRFIIKSPSHKFSILHPCDTVVHPEHRNKGLSVYMGNHAFLYDNNRYPVFMNMTCGSESLPGYLKMDFRPLEQKILLKKWRWNPVWIWKYRQIKSQKTPLENARISYGYHGDLLVSNKSMPEDMASVVEEHGYPENKLCLYQDQSFFKWRYNSCTQKYVFYFFMKDNTVKGYVVVRLSTNNNTGLIIDYAQAGVDAIKKILKYIIKAKHFIDLSIYSYGIDKQLYKTFSDLGFALQAKWMKFIPGRGLKKKPLFPLLVRPVKETVSEQDFVLYGLNILDFSNWLIKPICSDSV